MGGGGGMGGNGDTRRPFPIEPLIDAERLSTKAFAELLGIRRRQLCRWKNVGLTVRQADELAMRLGYHPAEIWAAWTQVDAVAA